LHEKVAGEKLLRRGDQEQRHGLDRANGVSRPHRTCSDPRALDTLRDLSLPAARHNWTEVRSSPFALTSPPSPGSVSSKTGSMNSRSTTQCLLPMPTLIWHG